MCKLLISQYIILLAVIQVNTDYILKQVLILSRHHLRAPLNVNNNDITPRPWPEWKEEAGTLTSKGKELEEDMGAYFASWLFKEKIIDTQCPDEENFYVYTNYFQRTIATGEAFVKGAFPFCKIKVHHKENNDPTFNSVLTNNTDAFKENLTDDMEHEIRIKRLNKAYKLLEDILDYTSSTDCKHYNRCNLKSDKNNVTINNKAGAQPNVEVPLAVVYKAIDIFIMQYYYGFPIEQVAWGMLDTHEKRQIIVELFYDYQNVVFNSSLTGELIAAPLIQYISNILLNEKPKVTLLVGHDSTMFGILKGLKFKPYNLLEQYEKIPTGGKIVFQKWYNSDTGEDLLKIEYVYLTSDEIRNGTRISFDNPPVRTTLEIEGCATDRSGFCLWVNFVRVLHTLIKI